MNGLELRGSRSDREVIGWGNNLTGLRKRKGKGAHGGRHWTEWAFESFLRGQDETQPQTTADSLAAWGFGVEPRPCRPPGGTVESMSRLVNATLQFTHSRIRTEIPSSLIPHRLRKTPSRVALYPRQPLNNFLGISAHLDWTNVTIWRPSPHHRQLSSSHLTTFLDFTHANHKSALQNVSHFCLSSSGNKEP